MKTVFTLSSFAFVLVASGSVDVEDDEGHHHHHHHHGRHRRHHHVAPPPPVAPSAKKKAIVHGAPAVPQAAVATQAVKRSENNIVDKMKKLEAKLAQKVKARASAMTPGHLLVNGPLPSDFAAEFAKGVGQAASVDPAKVQVTGTSFLEGSNGIVEVNFVAPPSVVKSVENDAADPESALARGSLHSFLVAKDSEAKEPETKLEEVKPEAGETELHPAVKREAAPVEEKGIDIDTQLPYGDLEPFGREDTAQELTESSVKESNEMVDQLERAEVAEEKRSVFRALTRLRGAAITSFDGVARSQTGNIDEYNKVHKWRNTHPLHHLADEESDVAKWAFPDNADF